MGAKSCQLTRAHGDFRVVLLQVAVKAFSLLQLCVPDKLKALSVMVLHDEIPCDISHGRNCNKTRGDVFPGHSACEHHADEYEQEHQRRTRVALYHDDTERHQEVRAQ